MEQGALVSAGAAKRLAATKALEWVQPGMTIGLGTGSTAACFVEALAERVRGGLTIRGVPTSTATENLARSRGVPLVALAETNGIDLTVDGADEVDSSGSAIKGGGGALLREKVVAAATRGSRIAVVDASKWVSRLGNFPLPVEVVPFAAVVVQRRIEAAWKVETVVRGGTETPFRTDNGNAILDCRFGERQDWPAIAAELDGTPGVVCHGIFWKMFDVILVGDEQDVRVERARRE
jgi:ribose 5-phosphate isomerase A